MTVLLSILSLSLWLLIDLYCVLFEGWSRAASLFPPSPRRLPQQSKERVKGWGVFTSHSSTGSHCLTLTSQYDTGAMCLSPPDITTVLGTAGARGLFH